MFENILRWAWGTLLTAIVTAVLTMFLRHGKRWFRPVQKFIRTGRVGTARRSSDGRGRMPARAVQGVKEPRMTLVRVLTALAQLTGRGSSTTPPQNSGSAQGSDIPLDLKF